VKPDSEESFEIFKFRFHRNPQWTMELTDAEKKALFDSHVDEINPHMLDETE
ncbi:unnamed protein product, partial [Candidula unifasciata]